MKNLYIMLIAGSLLLLSSIFIFSKKQVKKIPSYKDRKGTIALSAEWLNSKTVIEGLLTSIEQDPSDYRSMLMLSQAYIQESRITGDHAYYDKAALDLLEIIIENEPANFDALCCKATVLLSQHHFHEGLAVAQKALPLNPYNSFVYGILCDANLELGKYEEAVTMADKMVALRPDIRSYARVSYLREIYGDLPGAIEAMKMAVASGYPGLEQTEWTRCMLAHLYENTGDLVKAEEEYNLALAERPNYPFALGGLGRIEKSKGNVTKAIKHFEDARNIITEYTFADELTDLYKLNNNKIKAESNALEVIDMLGAGSVNENEKHGHYADRELAYAYLRLNNVDKALEHALNEYDRRPDNIDVCETLAWVRYKRMEFAEAHKLMFGALKTGNQNPNLLCRAGLIKIKFNEVEEGREMIKKAIRLNPIIDNDVKGLIKDYLAYK